MPKNNLIDITPFLKTSSPQKEEKRESPQYSSPPFPLTPLRKKTISQERREVRRSFFREFIRAKALVPGKGLLEIFLQNISENGLAFDLEKENGHFKNGELVSLRIYITYDTYFPFTVKIQHTRKQKNEGFEVYRHGASFIKEDINEKALVYFAKFMENATTVLRRDKGDVRVSGITD